ncbi:putative kelch-type beta propeller [Helianthus debilis subsp. tardiflorus]
MGSLIDVKFSREAIDAVGCKGKLYMVNGGKEGVVYDVNSDEWWQMAEGMVGGWKGPAAAMDEEIIYMVDEQKGVLRKYDDVVEVWVDVLEDDMLKGAEHIAAGGGRVCVVRGGGVGILVVDVAAATPWLSVLDTPAGQQVLGIHILPRMCSPEFQSPEVLIEFICCMKLLFTEYIASYLGISDRYFIKLEKQCTCYLQKTWPSYFMLFIAVPKKINYILFIFVTSGLVHCRYVISHFRVEVQ